MSYLEAARQRLEALRLEGLEFPSSTPRTLAMGVVEYEINEIDEITRRSQADLAAWLEAEQDRLEQLDPTSPEYAAGLPAWQAGLAEYERLDGRTPPAIGASHPEPTGHCSTCSWDLYDSEPERPRCPNRPCIRGRLPDGTAEAS